MDLATEKSGLFLHLVLVCLLVIFVCVFELVLLQCLGQAVLSLFVQLFGEARVMKGFIFGLLHRAFQRRKRIGGRKKRNGKQYQASELATREKCYGQAGLPDESFHPGSFAHFLHPTLNTSWALVLKMPQWDTSHKQIIRR